jgi:hypothetical protein
MSLRKKIQPLSRFSVSVLLVVLFALVTRLFSFSVTTDKKTDDNDAVYRDYISKNYKIYSLALPEGLTFCGEKVPLEDVDVRERLDREVVINTFWHSQTLFHFKRANRWFPLIEKILKDEGIPDDFKYLAMIESGFDNVVSPAGASGYWQFMKMTGIKYGLEINDYVDERYHVEKATRAAAAYLREANSYFKNWTLTAASYNMGIGGIQQKLKEQKAKSYYNLMLVPETYRYVFRILAAKEIYENPRFYGFNVRFKDMYIPFETEKIIIDSTLNDLAAYAIQKGFNYKILKILNPWLRDNKLPVKNGKKYEILFPAEKFPLSTIEP